MYAIFPFKLAICTLFIGGGKFLIFEKKNSYICNAINDKQPL